MLRELHITGLGVIEDLDLELHPGLNVAGGEHLGASAAYRGVSDELRGAGADLDELSSAAREREREMDLLAYQVREIESVSPRAGESDDLEAEEARLAHVERLLERAAQAEDALTSE